MNEVAGSGAYVNRPLRAYLTLGACAFLMSMTGYVIVRLIVYRLEDRTAAAFVGSFFASFFNLAIIASLLVEPLRIRLLVYASALSLQAIPWVVNNFRETNDAHIPAFLIFAGLVLSSTSFVIGSVLRLRWVMAYRIDCSNSLSLSSIPKNRLSLRHILAFTTIVAIWIMLSRSLGFGEIWEWVNDQNMTRYFWICEAALLSVLPVNVLAAMSVSNYPVSKKQVGQLLMALVYATAHAALWANFSGYGWDLFFTLMLIDVGSLATSLLTFAALSLVGLSFWRKDRLKPTDSVSPVL